MISADQKAQLTQIYSDPDNVASFRSARRLYTEARKTMKNLSYEDVTEYLKGIDSYTLHARMGKKFARENYLVNAPGVILGGGTCISEKMASSNDGYKYLSVFADMYSRFLFVYPLKTKTGKETGAKMNHLLNNSKHNYSAFFSDMGTEYYNTHVSKVLKKHSMKQYSVYSSDVKNGLVEISIKHLKTRIFRYLTHTNTQRYIDVLPSLVLSFNKSKMTALFNQSPMQVYTMKDRAKIRMLTQKMYKRFRERKVPATLALNVGEYVRISRLSKTQFVFNKDYLPQASEEIFQINKVDQKSVPVTYYLKDLSNEGVLGKFYRRELQPVILTGEYKIKVLKTVTENGVKKHLVSWLGYPSSFNSYIEDKDIIK
jgi:hypothetical protein